MFYSFVIFTIFSICTSLSKDLPSYLPKCYLDDPKLNECVLRAFNEVRPYVNNGIKEIGLPPLNPFFVPIVTVQHESSAANYTATFTNYTTEGLNNYDIKEFQYDPETMLYRFKIEFDTLLMYTTVETNGHVAHIPLRGKGFARAIFGPVKAILEIKGGIKELKGIKYYSPKEVHSGLHIGEGSFYVEGLFGNNQQLVRLTNELLNANSPMVVEALTPALEKLAETGVMRFMKTLTKIPYYQLFPPSR